MSAEEAAKKAAGHVAEAEAALVSFRARWRYAIPNEHQPAYAAAHALLARYYQEAAR